MFPPPDLPRKRRTWLYVALGIGALLVMASLSNQTSTGGSTRGSVFDGPTSASETEMLRHTIVSVGDNCDRVTRTFLQGTETKTGKQFWNVACSNGQNYVVTAGDLSQRRC